MVDLVNDWYKNIFSAVHGIIIIIARHGWSVAMTMMTCHGFLFRIKLCFVDGVDADTHTTYSAD